MQYFRECQTLDEAKRLYKELALKLHPDRKGGDTKAFQELQNQFENFRPGNEKYKGEFDAWNAKEYREVIEQLMKIPNIEIEICGSWIWLHGDTKPVKEQIKAVETGESIKRTWVKKKLKWAFRPANYKKRSGKDFSFEEIQAKYGSARKRSEGKRAVKA